MVDHVVSISKTSMICQVVYNPIKITKNANFKLLRVHIHMDGAVHLTISVMTP